MGAGYCGMGGQDGSPVLPLPLASMGNATKSLPFSPFCLSFPMSLTAVTFWGIFIIFLKDLSFPGGER